MRPIVTLTKCHFSKWIPIDRVNYTKLILIIIAMIYAYYLDNGSSTKHDPNKMWDYGGSQKRRWWFSTWGVAQDNNEDMLNNTKHPTHYSVFVIGLSSTTIVANEPHYLGLFVFCIRETFEIYLVIIIVNLVSHKRMWNECYFFGHMIVSQIVWTCF